jgi:hypothetical protein
MAISAINNIEAPHPGVRPSLETICQRFTPFVEGLPYQDASR